jgi:lipopolysaccharide transport system ATP-binding protein
MSLAVMSNDIAIRADGLGKQFRIGAQSVWYKTFRESLMESVAGPVRRIRSRMRGEISEPKDVAFWALRDVTFEVKRGDVLGIIGRNGAGKSTLLKVLSRITEPTEGYAEVHGRIGSLLEVGTGFHPELTGRENIFLSGAILGMRRAEIIRRFDEIVDFSEVEKFIDTPVKRFSSGMYLRLAFAVASHLDPEILLVDEVLAVGDAAFQKKCLGKMQNVAHEGRTVLFVSHNIGAVAGLCNAGIYLSQGNVVVNGGIDECIARYMHQLGKSVSYEIEDKPGHRAFIKSARVNGANSITSGQSLEVDVTVFSRDSFAFSLDWRIRTELGTPIASGTPHIQMNQVEMLAPGLNRFRVSIGPLLLAEGNFTLSLDVNIPWTEYIERVEDCLEFQVEKSLDSNQVHPMKAAWNTGAVLFPFKWERVERTGG